MRCSSFSRQLSHRHLAGLVLATGLLVSSAASAHVSITSGPAAANKSQKITFGVGHGCEDVDGNYDTLRVRVELPAGVTSVRALFSDFGKPTLIRTAGVVTAVEWTKPAADLLAADEGYYELTIRARVPDVAFSQLQFNVRQTCLANAAEITADWDQPAGSTTGNPAPQLTVVAARTPGWNRIVLGATTTIAAADLGLYFGDAQIVWRGTEAYSPNAITATLIGMTPGASVLTGDLAPGDELWVRY